MTNIISVEELIKNKVKIEKSNDKEIITTLKVPSIGGKIKLSFTKNDIHDFQEVTSKIDREQSDEVIKEALEEAGHNLIYTVVAEPNLRSKELQEAYGCKEPFEIVKKIFEEGEMSDIINFVHAKAGFKNGHVVEVEDLKN